MALYWHVHHNQLFEDCWDYEGRKAFILAKKPKGERKLRLKLMKPVQDVKAVTLAWEACNKAVAPAQEDYYKTIAPAWEVRNKAIDLAQENFYNAIGLAWETYKKIIASVQETCDKAVASYDKAIASAQKDYDKAIALAQEACNEAVAEVHQRECPDCPWDGKTIFSKK